MITTLTLVLLAWFGLAVVVWGVFHWALAPRRAERAYRRWQQ